MIRTICLDCIFFHYLSRELTTSFTYRLHFAKKYKTCKFKFILLPTRTDLIDYKWNSRVTEMVREKCELDHALSWLSTLGGAFSALGDYFAECAETAGKISINQLRLALRYGDPNIVARCRLYFSLSLIQQKRFKLAKYIIQHEYENTLKSPVIDHRLIKMCKGIWSKLQYEHKMYLMYYKSGNMWLLIFFTLLSLGFVMIFLPNTVNLILSNVNSKTDCALGKTETNFVTIDNMHVD